MTPGDSNDQKPQHNHHPTTNISRETLDLDPYLCLAGNLSTRHEYHQRFLGAYAYRRDHHRLACESRAS